MAINIITGFNSASREQIDKRSGPYESTALALAALGTNSRVMGLPIYVIPDGTQDSAGNFITGTVSRYEFTGGIDDSDLVEIEAGGNPFNQDLNTFNNVEFNELEVVEDMLIGGDIFLELNGQKGIYWYSEEAGIFFDDSQDSMNFTNENGNIIFEQTPVVRSSGSVVFEHYNLDYSVSVIIKKNLVTEDRDYQLPDEDGTFALTSDVTLQAILDSDGTWISGENNWEWAADKFSHLNADEEWGFFISPEEGFSFTNGAGSPVGKTQIQSSGVLIGNGTYQATITAINLTGNRDFTFPDAAGTFALADVNNNFTVAQDFLGDITTEGDIFFNDLDSKGVWWTADETGIWHDDSQGSINFTNENGNIIFEQTPIVRSDSRFIFRSVSTDDTITININKILVTADREYQLPDTSGTIALASDVTLQTVLDADGSWIDGDDDWGWESGKIYHLNADEEWGFSISSEEGLVFTNGVGNNAGKTYIGPGEIKIGNGNYQAAVGAINLTSNRDFRFPDQAGTFALTSDLSGYLTSIAANSVGVTELDVTDGTGGQALTTDGSGNLSFATITPGGTDTNYYLDGISQDVNTLNFEVNGSTDIEFIFGSNAFTSTSIPTVVSDLTNDAGYTGDQDLSSFITASSTNTLTNKSGSNSQWTNDQGYITSYSVTSSDVTTALGYTPQEEGFFGYAESTSTGYTLSTTDKGQVVGLTSSSAITVTVNTGSLTDIGDIAYIDQMGTGEVTIAEGTSVNLIYNSSRTNVTDGQYSRVAIHKVSSTDYRIFGELKSA